MATAATDVPYNPDVLLHVDLNYTTAVLEDWGLDENATRHIHRMAPTELDKGRIDGIIAGLIVKAATEWQENSATGEPQ